MRLTRNYRSTPQVIALANTVLAKAATASSARLTLVAQRPDGPAPAFSEYADDAAEARGVAVRVAALIEGGTRASEIAVLYRTNGQSEAVEQALTDAGVPYLLRGGERFFSRREVREAVLLLRGAARADTASRADGPDLPTEVAAVLAGAGWGPEPPPGAGAARDRWESLNALVQLATDLAATRAAVTLVDLVAELDERAAAQHAPTVDGVTLASLHAAKGLEWDAVFLVGLSEGLVPITFAADPEAIEEERRLVYVGLTRAREHLALSWALARTPGGRQSRTPSRFLDGIRPGASAAERDGGRAAARGRRSRTVPTCRVCGKALADPVPRKLGRCESCPSAMDEAVYDRLKAWRLGVSREIDKPAFVVFTDATLTAIAERAPGSRAELAQVSGVGATKLDAYGDDVLAILAGRDRAPGAADGARLDASPPDASRATTHA